MSGNETTHSGEILDQVNGFDVIDCRRCGFRHIMPIPQETELKEVYKHEYYTSEKPLYLERFRQDLDWWNQVYAERYETFESFLEKAQRSLLEVGSGPGYFLLHGKIRGWQTLGVEPSAKAAAHSCELGVEVVEDFLTAQLAEQIGTFDVLHMYNVLEHVPDPVELLQLSHNLLNQQGLLCLSVPNDYSPFQTALQKGCDYSPWWLAPPHHINYFNFASLSALLERQGFEILLKEATFPIDLFLLMGENYVGNDSLGRKCHDMRMTFERNLAKAGMSQVKRNFYQALAASGLGREIVIYARRKQSTGV